MCRAKSVIGHMDNSYLAFRRDAVRFISAGRRVMWTGRDGRTKLTKEKKNKRSLSSLAGPREITSDPYVSLKMGKQSFKTKWKKKDLNPTWDETFTFQAMTVGLSNQSRRALRFHSRHFSLV